MGKVKPPWRLSLDNGYAFPLAGNAESGQDHLEPQAALVFSFFYWAAGPCADPGRRRARFLFPAPIMNAVDRRPVLGYVLRLRAKGPPA